MPRPKTLEDEAWEAAARLIFQPRWPVSAVTWALIALRGQLTPGHPVLGLLEAHREYLRGERSALTEDELAPLLPVNLQERQYVDN